jgi:hypothetical protein
MTPRTFPYLRRKSIGFTHRIFSKVGRESSKTEVTDTATLLYPKKFTGDVVRLGGDSDGSYVVPDDFQGITSSISPGVSEEIDFDLELGRKGIHSYMFDASVTCPNKLTDMQTFESKFIDSFESTTTTTLNKIVNNVQKIKPGDMILQMDIEGAEYRCLNATDITTLANFRIIVLEFHALDAYIRNNLYRKFWIHPILRKLRANHDVVHVHANNNGAISNIQGVHIPNLLEITYLRRDRWPNSDSESTNCRELDILNRTDRQALIMDDQWFESI